MVLYLLTDEQGNILKVARTEENEGMIQVQGDESVLNNPLEWKYVGGELVHINLPSEEIEE